jgi:S1-C subfamily serine protease
MSKRTVVDAGVVVIVTVIAVASALTLSGPVDPSPKPLPPRPAQFTELVQESVKGVVHLRMDDHGQGSGFVVGPRLIVTAKHCVQGVTDFLMTTHTGCQVRSTRAISNKDADVGFVWVDDLECVNEDRDHRIEHGGEHAVVLVPLRLGSIKDCRLGQTVYTVGSPFGAANFNAASLGVISGVGRDWSEWGGGIGWSVAFTVDSPGAPGNSGGPVFTKDGAVRGVLVGGLSPSHICVMPCDLFIEDLPVVALMFAIDRYSREEVAVSYDPYYDHAEGDECY